MKRSMLSLLKDKEIPADPEERKKLQLELVEAAQGAAIASSNIILKQLLERLKKIII